MSQARYYRSLTFWTMGEKYWLLTQAVCDQIAKNRNIFLAMSDSPISLDEFEQKTKWNDINMVIPLLFDFYHGLELMLKGFVLFAEGSQANFDHSLSQLLNKFVKYHQNEEELVALFRKYLDIAEMPILLREFLNNNNLSVNRFYESLRYPFNRKLSREYQHFMLKYKGTEGVRFYRSLSKDIRQMMGLIVKLGKSLK